MKPLEFALSGCMKMKRDSDLAKEASSELVDEEQTKDSEWCSIRSCSSTNAFREAVKHLSMSLSFCLLWVCFVCLYVFCFFAVLPSHTCGNPGLIPRGIIHGTRYNIGDKIRYTCVMGYVLEGHAVLTCIVSPGSGASWDFPAPFCRGMIFIGMSLQMKKGIGCRFQSLSEAIQFGLYT